MIYDFCIWPLVMCVYNSVETHEYALCMCIDIVYAGACVVIDSACICNCKDFVCSISSLVLVSYHLCIY